MKPSIGRIVHYIDSAENHLAAIITEVNADETVQLYVLPPKGQNTHIENVSQGTERYTFHEPERV